MLLLFRSSHLHPKNIRALRASWYESAMSFFRSFQELYCLECTHLGDESCSSQGQTLEPLWATDKLDLSDLSGFPSTERINVHFLSFSPNSKFNVRWDPTPPKTMLFWAKNTVSLVFASTLASWVLGSKMMWNGSARKCLLQTKSRGPSQSRRMATAFRSSWQLSAWGLWDSLGR